MPSNWDFGYFARNTTSPDPNKPAPTGEMFVANENLRDWAFDQQKDIVLPDTRSLEETRMLYTEHTNARNHHLF